MTHLENILAKAVKEKTVACMRYEATLLSYQAATFAEEDSQVIDRHRAEVHALVDIILDNVSMIAYCTNKIASGEK